MGNMTARVGCSGFFFQVGIFCSQVLKVCQIYQVQDSSAALFVYFSLDRYLVSMPEMRSEGRTLDPHCINDKYLIIAPLDHSSVMVFLFAR